MLTITSLYKSFGNRRVLNNLSLQVAPGEIYGLLGPNGAGKTTTINILCNLTAADQGTVLIKNQPVSHQTKHLLGIAPQESLLYKSLTCAENLHFFAKIYGIPHHQRRQRVRTCLEAVGIGDRHNSIAATLSGGMRRRLSMAIAFIHNPALLILDEPTTGLDIEARYEIWELIRNLQQQNITILLTTHLLDEAERLCHRIGIMKDGKILTEGTLAELKNNLPAQDLVIVETPDEAAAITCARQHGFIPRRYGRDLAFWLPHPLDLKDILACFDGIPLNSIARPSVRLEHIYLEITQ